MIYILRQSRNCVVKRGTAQLMPFYAYFHIPAPSVAPPSFRASNVSSREFSLSWVAPEALDTNGILRNYILSVSELHSNLPLLGEVEIEAVGTEFLVDSLIPYTLYNCCIAAMTVRRGPTAVIQVRTGEEGKLNFSTFVLLPYIISKLPIPLIPPREDKNGCGPFIRRFRCNSLHA